MYNVLNRYVYAMIMIYKRVIYINFSIGKRMKRMTLIGLSIGALLVLSGCVEPDFNSNKQDDGIC